MTKAAVGLLRTSREKLDRERQKLTELIEAYDCVLADLNGTTETVAPEPPPAKPAKPAAGSLPAWRVAKKTEAWSRKRIADEAERILQTMGALGIKDLWSELVKSGVKSTSGNPVQPLRVALGRDDRFVAKGRAAAARWDLAEPTEESDPALDLLGNDRILQAAHGVLESDSPLHAEEIHKRLLDQGINLGGVGPGGKCEVVERELDRARVVFKKVGPNTWSVVKQEAR